MVGGESIGRHEVPSSEGGGGVTGIWFLILSFMLGVPSKKKDSIFKDIIQIEVDLPPSHPIFDKFIFDKFIFDKVLIMLTSLPPLEFLTNIMKF